jgi:serine protease AprX
MAYIFSYKDDFEEPEPDDLVSFIVVAQPASGMNISDTSEPITVSRVQDYLPHAHTIEQIRAELREKGFEVFEDPSPIVSARGPVKLFRTIFTAPLVKRIRHVETGTLSSDSDTANLTTYTVVSVIDAPGAEIAAPVSVEGAAWICPISPPLFVQPSLPPVINEFQLRVPGDIAQLTGASATHRLSSRAGGATGDGVGVAVIDSGFAPHPYYQSHNYDITAVAASDATHPMVDELGHGTSALAPLLACAPDVKAYGIKVGQNPILAIDRAVMFHDVKVISLSWVYDLDPGENLTRVMRAINIRLAALIRRGKTVIAAAGNGEISFPAMMPDIISVGGVAINELEKLSVWDGASSFTSTVFPGRDVPDLCGFASSMLLPTMLKGGTEAGWKVTTGTSFASPQVAGIAALMIQKNPALTPQGIRDILCSTATDIRSGQSASQDHAIKGRDRATGDGLVNAHRAWSAVPENPLLQHLEIVAALVSLRATQDGVLYVEDHTPPPAERFRATPDLVVRVYKTLSSAGFTVFPDAVGLTLSIEGTASLFANYFKVPVETFNDSAVLEMPAELKEDVEAVTLVRPPEFL